MGYSIKNISQKVGLSEYTLRYYEKEGLLPCVERDKNGNRSFNDNDLEWIELICCLRETGMSIAEIKKYVNLCMFGDASVKARKQIFVDHKRAMELKISQYIKYMHKIDEKIACFEDIEQNRGIDTCNPALRLAVKSNA